MVTHSPSGEISKSRMRLAPSDPGRSSGDCQRIGVGARLVLLDDRKARHIATGAYNLRVTGIAGVRVFAKRAGSIPPVRPLLEVMIARGDYLSHRLVDQTTSAASEAPELPG